MVNSNKHVQTYGKCHNQNLQGSVVTQTTLGGLTTQFRLPISSGVCMPKIMKIGWQ